MSYRCSRAGSYKHSECAMPKIRFTQNIQRHVACPPLTVEGSSLRQVLEAYFTGNPQARGYVLDDQGALRKHMALFINGEPVLDRKGLADPVLEDGVVDVVQALSGG
jgi:sulfur-carrier protein